MRKIVYIFLTGMIVLALIIMLSGCSADTSKNPSTNTSGEVEEKVEKVEEKVEEVKEPIQEKEEVVTEQNSNLEVQEEPVVENNTQKNEEPKVEESVLDKINSASEVKISEEFISLNKQYNIYVDGIQVAKISGKYINLTGDVFTLTDMHSNVLAKEKQIKRWGVKLNRLAHVMDPSGNTTGYIGEEFFSDFFSISKYKFHFYDKDKKEMGHTREQVLSLLYKYNVYNNSDEMVYKVDKNFTFLVDEYTINKVKDSDIQMKDVVFLTCIVDAIMDASDD